MTALITGASGGIGAELARLFAKDGIDLLLVARTAEKLLALQSELEADCHVSVSVLAKDLSEDGAAQAVFDFAQANHIILVNNAGFGDWGFFAQSDLAKQRQMIQLNIAALTELTHLFLPAMIARKNGRILNVASVASFMPGAKMSVYYATKAFVRSFSEVLSVELKKMKSGVLVTALCPGPIKTAFWNRAEAESSSLFRHFFFADSASVARYGYRAMKKGKTLAIPGLSVRIAVALAKILPRAFVRNLVYAAQK
ncbi:MAG: SDR family oxidoreductase [Treponemataceae bacterium]|nr:SDR family oxidoreductase [Treponemataceae bacterium]